MRPLLLRLALLAALASPAGATESAAVAIAGAANLVHVIEALRTDFARATPGARVTVTVGASGSLFAQIRHGAPFDVFLSADLDYPRQLVAAGLGDAASARTFATGVLAVWTIREDLELDDLPAALRSPLVRKVALAQPRTAPYGRAAERLLERFGPSPEPPGRRVLGENVAQAAQFVETGTADLGFVALALLRAPGYRPKGRWRILTPAEHAPVTLEHGAVLTRRGAANPAARAFLDYLVSPGAKRILKEHGYQPAP